MGKHWKRHQADQDLLEWPVDWQLVIPCDVNGSHDAYLDPQYGVAWVNVCHHGTCLRVQYTQPPPVLDCDPDTPFGDLPWLVGDTPSP